MQEILKENKLCTFSDYSVRLYDKVLGYYNLFSKSFVSTLIFHKSGIHHYNIEIRFV